MINQLSCITTLLLSILFVFQSNAATLGENTHLSVISNNRIESKEPSPAEGVKLLKYLGFVSKDGLTRNDTVNTVELHPNDELALARCTPKTMMYELLNFQIQLYLTIENTSFRPGLLPVCERVEKCIGSMYLFSSRSEALEDRLFSPIFLVLKQVIKMACNLERKESNMKIRTIVNQVHTTHNQLMMFKNVMKTVINYSGFF